MTRFELWGPWTGAYLKPATRRKWLKHRFVGVIAAVIATVIVCVVLVVHWLDMPATDCSDPNRVHAWENICQ